MSSFPFKKTWKSLYTFALAYPALTNNQVLFTPDLNSHLWDEILAARLYSPNGLAKSLTVHNNKLVGVATIVNGVILNWCILTPDSGHNYSLGIFGVYTKPSFRNLGIGLKSTETLLKLVSDFLKASPTPNSSKICILAQDRLLPRLRTLSPIPILDRTFPSNWNQEVERCFYLKHQHAPNLVK